MKPKSHLFLRCGLPAAALLLPIFPYSTHGASITWNNSATDFNAGSSWVGGNAPGAADIATFTGITSTSPALSAAVSVKGLAFSDAASSGYLISGNTLTLGIGGIDGSAVTSGTNTITSNLALGSGSQTWTAGTGSTLAVNPTALTRSAGATVRINKTAVTGTVSTTTLVNTNGIIGAWAVVNSSGASANNSANGDTFATVSGGNIVPYTSATALTGNGAWGGVPSGGAGTINYDVSGAMAVTGLSRNVHTIRYTGTGATQPSNINPSGNLLTINGFMNSGSGEFFIGGIGGSNNFGVNVTVGANLDLVLAPMTAGITLRNAILNNGANASAVTVLGNQTVTLAGVSSYTGATTVAGGTLLVNGTGTINTSSGITIKGANAKYLHTSSVASTPALTLNQGTLDGTGTLGSVTVADNPSAIVTHGNGGASALTFGSLTFGGDAAVSLNVSAGAGLKVTGVLATTPANGQVVLNVPGLLPNGLVNLINFGTFNGNLADFSVNFTGLGVRQNLGAVQLNGSNIAVNITGEGIVWAGASDDAWQTATSGDGTGANNWARKTAHTATNFWVGDTVEFNDTYNLGSGEVPVTRSQVILAADVSPASTTFANSAVNYELSGSGIVAGSLTKNGTGTVTLLNSNSYNGSTTISQGKLQLGNGSTDGSIAGTSSVTNNGILEYNLGGSLITAQPISGTGSLVKKGSGSLTITGANTYSGGTTIDEGLLVAGTTAMNGGPITLNESGTLTFTGNGQTSTSTLTGSGFILNDTANTIVFTGDHSGFSGSFTHSAAANNTQFNSAVAASQNANYNLRNGEIIFAAIGDYTVKFGSLSSNAGNIRGGNTAIGTATVEVGNLGLDSSIDGNFNNGTTKILALQKVGSGRLTLNGGANYTGATIVNAGILDFGNTPKTLGSSAFTVADAAGLSVKAVAGTTLLPTASLTLGASNLTFDFNSLSPTVTQISTGALTLNGSVTVDLLNTIALGSGAYKLIDYTTFSGAGSFPSGAFGVGNRATATIVNNLVDTSIDLVVAADVPKWTGLSSGQWMTGDTGANPNWKLAGSGTATDYLDADQVLFDDSAAGTRSVVIDSSTVFPASTTFNTATSAYTLSGAFGIATGSFTKSGTGSVVVTTANTYTGATTINAGTLQLGNGTVDGSIVGTASVTNNGTLSYNLTADHAAVYPISGTGNLTKVGAGILTLSGNNTSSGGSSLDGGMIVLAANGALGTGPIALAAGTTLNVNKDLPVANVVTGAGAIVSTGSFTNTGDFSGFSGSFTHNSAFVSAAFNTATATSQNAVYHIASNRGSEQGIIAGGNGDYTLKLGSLSGVVDSLFRGGNVATGTTLLEIGNLGTSTEFAGSINSGVTKAIALTKVGVGTFTLSGASNYTGATQVNAGTLSVTGSLTATISVTVGGMAILGGSGTIAAPITASGTIAPGVGAGTLSTGPATLTGTLAIEVDGDSADKLVSTGTIDLTGSSLTVSLLPGGFTGVSYIIAEGTAITGSFASVPSGYSVSIISGGVGQQAVLTSTAAGYASWAATHAGGQIANLDFDSDGVANGVEYFMNAADGFTANPTLVSGAITWTNGGKIPASAYGTQFVVQTSGDLSTWKDVPSDNLTTNTDSTLTYTPPTGSGTFFVRLKVTPN